MWVKLTAHGYALLRGVYQLDPPMLDAVTREIVRRRRAVVYVRAPYVAWDRARRDLYNRAFGPRGGRRHSQKESLFTALKAITTEANYIHRHPAFVGKAMPGWLAEEFPAWSSPSADRLWEPHPTHKGRFVILEPSWEHVAGDMQVTVWRPKEPEGDDWLRDEVTHQRLWRPGQG